jgi:hypothetical protein
MHAVSHRRTRAAPAPPSLAPRAGYLFDLDGRQLVLVPMTGEWLSPTQWTDRYPRGVVLVRYVLHATPSAPRARQHARTAPA